MPQELAEPPTEPLLIGVDLGTRGAKVALVTATGQVLGLEFESVKTRLLPGGGAEQDPEDWWQAIRDCTTRLLTSQRGAACEVAAICFSGQWGGTVPVGDDGHPTHPALIWMDGRGARYAQKVTAGLVTVPVAGYSARKLRAWVARTGGAPARAGPGPGRAELVAHARAAGRVRRRTMAARHPGVPNVRASGRAVATSDTAVLRWCTDNRDPARIRWDHALAKMARLDARKLPEIVSPATVVGTLTPQASVDLRLPATVKVVSGTG